jgi:hypothetical protein
MAVNAPAANPITRTRRKGFDRWDTSACLCKLCASVSIREMSDIDDQPAAQGAAQRGILLF